MKTRLYLFIVAAFLSCGGDNKNQTKTALTEKEVALDFGCEAEQRQRIEEERRAKIERDSIIKTDVEPYAWGNIKFGISMEECAKNKYVTHNGKYKPEIRKEKDESRYYSSIEGYGFDIGDAVGANSNSNLYFLFKCDELCQVQLQSGEYAFDNVDEMERLIYLHLSDCAKYAQIFEKKMGEPTTYHKDDFLEELTQKGYVLLYLFQAGSKKVTINIAFKTVIRGSKKKNAVMYYIIIDNEDYPKNKEPLERLREEREKAEKEKKEAEDARNRETIENGF